MARIFLARWSTSRAQQRLRLLIGFALGDVAHDDGGEPFFAGHALRDRGLDGEFLTIGTQRADRAERAHPATGFARRAEPADMLVVIGAEAMGNKAFERLPDRLVGGQLEHQLRGRVELDDAMVLVDRDDRIHRGRHNRPPAVRGCASRERNYQYYGTS